MHTSVQTRIRASYAVYVRLRGWFNAVQMLRIRVSTNGWPMNSTNSISLEPSALAVSLKLYGFCVEHCINPRTY